MEIEALILSFFLGVFFVKFEQSIVQDLGDESFGQSRSLRKGLRVLRDRDGSNDSWESLFRLNLFENVRRELLLGLLRV